MVELQRAIEAGLLARDARAVGLRLRRCDRSRAETCWKTSGERARQRFIRANLGLVGMVSRQYAARCQLARRGAVPGGMRRSDHRSRAVRSCSRVTGSRRTPCSGSAPSWARLAAKHLGAMNLPTSRAEQLRAARGLEAELDSRPWPTLRRVEELARRPGPQRGLDGRPARPHQRPRSLELVDGHRTRSSLHAHDDLDAVLADAAAGAGTAAAAGRS